MTGMLLLFLTLRLPSQAGETPCNGVEQVLASIRNEIAAGNVTGAEQLVHQMEQSNPACPETLLAHARVAAARDTLAEAEDFFMRYADAAPNRADAYSYHAHFLMERQQYQRADALSAQALAIDSNDPVALAVRGEILDMKGQTKEGVELLEKACRLDPQNGDAHFRLGTIYDRTRRFADAVRSFQVVVKINSNNPQAWDYLALDLEGLGDVERADMAYRKGLAANQPGPHFDAFLDYNYGRFLMKRNDLTGSKQHLDRAVELTPDVRAPWYERAKLNLRLKDYQQARDDAERAANIRDPRAIIIDLQLYVLLEQIYARLGNTELAEKYAKLSRATPVPPRKD
jgi:tetratricopeptide (TPR) repeat protein